MGVADGAADPASASQLTIKGSDGLWGGAEVVIDPSLLRPGWLWNAKAQSWGTRGANEVKAGKPASGRVRSHGRAGGK